MSRQSHPHMSNIKDIFEKYENTLQPTMRDRKTQRHRER